ncbi:MAG TPA: hypothetical protein VH643_04275 [Gemmataceae bacterium]|jgi:hypothetical protein
MPKVNGKAQPVLDADGMPIKGKDNREQALACRYEIVAREKAHIRKRSLCTKSAVEPPSRCRFPSLPNAGCEVLTGKLKLRKKDTELGGITRTGSPIVPGDISAWPAIAPLPEQASSLLY